MVLGNIDQRDVPTNQPAIERDRVPRLDVNGGRHVLLADQALDKAGKMPGQRAH